MSFRRISKTDVCMLALAISILVLAACAKPGVTVSPPAIEVKVGETEIVTATVKSGKYPKEGVKVEFASEDESVATVDPASTETNADGKAQATVTGMAEGSTKVTATAEDKSDSADVTVSDGGLRITTASPLPPATQGQPYSHALQATNGQPPLSWSGTPPASLTLDSGSGEISGTPNANGDFSFDVTVTDNASPQQSDTKSFGLTINEVPPQLTITTDSPLPEATEGQPYSQTLQATDGQPPLSWSGTPAASLTLDSGTGEISGTPNANGDFTFDVTVTDNASPQQSDTKSFGLTINEVPRQLTITTASPLPEATEGQAYSQTLQATGGQLPLSWSGTPPASLTLDSGTGEISGTPNANGDFPPFAVTVTDEANESDTKNFQLHIEPAPRQIVFFGISADITNWHLSIDGVNQASTNPQNLGVGPGDVITWRAESNAFHGVVFADRVTTEAILDFDQNVGQPLNDDPNFDGFGAGAFGTNGFSGPIILARATVRPGAAPNDPAIDFLCKVHGGNGVNMRGRLTIQSAAATTAK